jgi:hypothetical protein
MGQGKHAGQEIPLDLSEPLVAGLLARVVRLNAFFANHALAPLEHRGFRRIFNEGGEHGFRWNKGGRLYSVGGGYQMAKKAERACATIDGEQVVEIDVRASQLTVLHALRGVAFDVSRDPYLVDGVPREVVKDWVMMTIGHDRFHTRWSKTAREKLEPAFGAPLQAAYPLARTRERILQHLPVLADWPLCGLTSLDLQFAESEAIIGAVESLAYTYGVASFPVYDSILVPVSKRELAEAILVETFEAQVGIKPILRVS